MTVAKICNRNVHTAQATEKVVLAAARMADHNVGTLVVLDPAQRPIGILTDRDLALRVIAEERDAKTTIVREVMTAHPRVIEQEMPIEDALKTMRRLGVRRLPVVDAERRLVGLISADDVLTLLADEMADLGELIGESEPDRRLTV
jgi:CBS domain-containing protein